VTAYSFAAPNGAAAYVPVAKGPFLSNRSAANNPAVAPTDNPDPLQFNLPCFIPAANASASAIVLLALLAHELRDLN
jgi:hypothetical protein